MAIREILTHSFENEDFFKKFPLISSTLMTSIIGFFLGYLAPFGTNTLGIYLAILYWQILCFIGALIFLPMSYFVPKYLVRFHLPFLVRFICSLFIATTLMSIIVTYVTSVFFLQELSFIKRFPGEFPRTLVIGTFLTLFFYIKSYLNYQKNKVLSHSDSLIPKNNNSSADKFMNKLPLEVRGKLLCLEMADHYLKVHTDKGTHMLLMRLKDAISELEHYSGLQTHRSWWVAENAVVGSIKENKKTLLKLENEQLVPVSRTFLPDVKAKNLL